MKRNKRMKYKRQKVPASTVALYIGMVVVILGICATVFIISFNVLNDNNDGSSSVDGNPNSSSGSFIIPNGEMSSSSSRPESSSTSSSGEQSSSGVQSSSSLSNQSSSSQSSKSPSSSSGGSSSAVQSSSSSSGNTLPTNFNKVFFKDDLFIGDSIFTGLYLYNYLDTENVAAEVNYTPAKALNTELKTHGVSALEYAKQRSPKRIYIMIGINGLNSAGLNTLKSSYSDLLTALKTELPDSTICCISLTPVARKTDYPNIQNSDVRSVNEYIQQQCKALGLDYYDFYSAISDDDGYFLTEYAEVDGMHFKGTTYKVLLSALQKKYS